MDLCGRGEIRLTEGVVSLSKYRPNSENISNALTVSMRLTTYIKWFERCELLL
jgi:hypothetical protein